jgi:type VI secretion system secreted protein Hcp
MALDAFLQFTKVGKGAPLEGETQDMEMAKLKPRPFDLKDWTFGLQQAVNVGSSSGGVGVGRVEFQPFQVTKNIDTGSPSFFHTMCAGTHYTDCALLIRKSGAKPASSGDVFLRFDFKLVFVTNVAWTGSDDAPTEAVTFEYGALQVTYTQQKPDGSMGASTKVAWSRVLNTNDFLDA